MAHPLHKIIGDCINYNIFRDCKIIKDPACGGKQYIPLFLSDNKSNATEYCNVDLLILKENKIQVIIEIEESNIKPTQICGKFLTSALSSYFIHSSENNIAIGMSDSVAFIQILDTSKLKKKSSKIKQWENLEESIQNILPNEGTKFNTYKLLYGKPSDFIGLNKSKYSELVTYINEVLK